VKNREVKEGDIGGDFCGGRAAGGVGGGGGGVARGGGGGGEGRSLIQVQHLVNS